MCFLPGHIFRAEIVVARFDSKTHIKWLYIKVNTQIKPYYYNSWFTRQFPLSNFNHLKQIKEDRQKQRIIVKFKSNSSVYVKLSDVATRWPSDGRASILALTFILVTRKSPDQKQEVSNQIKSKIRFLSASRSQGLHRRATTGSKKIRIKCRNHTDGLSFTLATKHGAGDFSSFFQRGSSVEANGQHRSPTASGTLSLPVDASFNII